MSINQSEFTMTERVDVDALHYIISNYDTDLSMYQNEFADSPEVQRERVGDLIPTLKKLMKKAGSTGVWECKYKKPNKIGWAEPIQCSLANIYRPLRNALVRNICDDLDMVNCVPRVLEGICIEEGIECPMLTEYNKNRDAILRKLIKKTKTNRDKVKRIFISLINGGKFLSWCKANKYQGHDEFVEQFAREMKTIQLELWDLHKEHHKWITRKQSTKKLSSHLVKYNNEKGSLIAFLTEDKTADIMACIQRCVEDENFSISTYMKDGFYVRKNKNREINRQFIDAIEESVMDEFPNYNIKLKVKPMTEFLVLPDKLDTLVIPDEKMRLFDVRWLGSKNTSYAHQKQYVEKFYASVRRPKHHFVYRSIDEDGEVIQIKIEKHDIKPVLQKLQCIGSDGKKTNFMAKWSMDCKMREYEMACYIPYNPEEDSDEVINPKFLNTFMGFNPVCTQEVFKNEKDHFTVENATKAFDDWKDVLYNMCGCDHLIFDYVLDWFASLIQTPRKRSTICPVFVGPKGCGKTWFYQVIEILIGKDNCFSTTNPDDLFGNHATGLFDILVLNINEMDAKDTRKYANQMKGIIDDTRTKNEKFMPMERKKLVFWAFATCNSLNFLYIDAGSGVRRWMPTMATDKYCINDAENPTQMKQFWKFMHQQKRNPYFIRCIYRFLMDRQVRRILNDAPKSEMYKNMISMQKPNIALLMQAFVESDVSSDCYYTKFATKLSNHQCNCIGVEKNSYFIANDELNKLGIIYGDTHGETKTIATAKQIKFQLKDKQFPHMSDRRVAINNKRKFGIVFHPEKIMQHLEKRHWASEEIKSQLEYDSDDEEMMNLIPAAPKAECRDKDMEALRRENEELKKRLKELEKLQRINKEMDIKVKNQEDSIMIGNRNIKIKKNIYGVKV